jgi:zinc transport system substrate-binding protein
LIIILIVRWQNVAVLALVAAACTQAAEGSSPTVVASVYPLAFAAERIAGPGWDVIDLTASGVDAHDIELSLDRRASIENAELLIYLGDIGFQPQVERAVEESSGRVLALGEQVIHAPQGGPPPGTDPHVWLDPGILATISSLISNEFVALDRQNQDLYVRRSTSFKTVLKRLERSYRRTLDPTDCRYQTAVVTHEAFNYMIGRYGFHQFGLAGLAPEAEPTVARLTQARQLIQSGKAGAVFYDVGEEAKRVALSVADDSGVPALPLSSLESRPPEGDYLTVMRENLRSFERGLGCG